MPDYINYYDVVCVDNAQVATRYVFNVDQWATTLEISHITDGAWEAVEQHSSVDIPDTYLGGELVVKVLPGQGGNPTKTINAGRVVSYITA